MTYIKPKLRDTTLVCIDCLNYGHAISALKKSMEQCAFEKVLFLTDQDFEIPGITTRIIPTISSKEEYSEFVIKHITIHIDTPYMLIVQSDGYILNGHVWDESWKQYDYIGAPWLQTDGYNVGNGGFSFRSLKLMLWASKEFKAYHPEDSVICRVYRPLAEANGFKFAPVEVADKFSFELREPCQPTFGFHAYFHKPYKETVVLKRSGAIGDIIMMEPVIAELLNRNYNVVLDIPMDAWQLYRDYQPKIKHLSEFDHERVPYKLVNLDMVYESNQRRPYLESYFIAAGIYNGILRNSVLYPKYPADKKLFNKYVVLHIDERQTSYRNIYGVKWAVVVRRLKSMGYHVIQIGAGAFNPVEGAIGMNTPTLSFLKWVIGTADLFIGVDSGPAHIAVAQSVPAVIFFGSVTPEKIYSDFSLIQPIINKCPVAMDGCWHLGTTEGVACKASKDIPPCCNFDTDEVIEKITEFNSKLYASRSN